MSQPAPEAPDDFFRFITKEVGRLFPLGWDRGYVRAVWSSSLTTSSCAESPRSRGGARGFLLEGRNLWGDGPRDRHEFVKACLGFYGTPPVDRLRSIISVETGGKKRLVSVAPASMGVLSPLHRVLYDFVSTKSWCLRGEADVTSFAEFTPVDGEVFVSGDYESATDELNLDVACHILGSVLRRCLYVPLDVRDCAVTSLFSVLSGGKRVVVQERGTLMGNLLSFPLLCLYNYLCFRFFVRRPVPVRVNGDDIVFRCRRSEWETWSDGVSRLGLRLSLGKTLVSTRIFSLNSKFFRSRCTVKTCTGLAGLFGQVWTEERVEVLPVVRSTSVFLAVEDPTALAGRFQSAFLGDWGRRRRELNIWLLRRLAPAIYSTQRSVTRGLGIPVSVKELKAAGLWEREVFYLSSHTEPPLPPPRRLFAQRTVPDGWSRVWSDFRADVEDEVDDFILSETVALSWERQPLPPSEVSQAHWEAVREGTLSYSSWASLLAASRGRPSLVGRVSGSARAALRPYQRRPGDPVSDVLWTFLTRRDQPGVPGPGLFRGWVLPGVDPLLSQVVRKYFRPGWECRRCLVWRPWRRAERPLAGSGPSLPDGFSARHYPVVFCSGSA